MGCDIHFYVETRDAETGNWNLVDELVREGEGEGDDIYVSTDYHKSFYKGRSYNLFSILADVRNGRGFAGVKTGEGFQPISTPRGVPDDASDGYKQLVASYGADGHSHSYHTIRQLLDYDWTQVTGLQGWVTFLEWESWSRWARAQGNGPDSYCGGVGGPNVQHIEPDAMDALVAQYRAIPDKVLREDFATQHSSTYALATWTVPYYRAAENFLSSTMPRLLALAGSTSRMDDVRCVFFFDN